MRTFFVRAQHTGGIIAAGVAAFANLPPRNKCWLGCSYESHPSLVKEEADVANLTNIGVSSNPAFLEAQEFDSRCRIPGRMLRL
jgi:hypothetical protein